MMVAATLAEKYWEMIALQTSDFPSIHIFEKNKELGTKVRISGGGRCNITTGYYKKQDLAPKYTRGRDFISHAMSQFWPRKMTQRCADHNCPIYCQDDMRCFPVSDKGSDVVHMFENIFNKHNIKIHFEEPVLDLVANHTSAAISDKSDKITSENPLSAEISPPSFTLTTHKWTSEYDFVVITSWWNAYTQTGSTGDGYAFAQLLWHTVTALWPSLNSFLVAEDWIKECSGISFQQATLLSEWVSVTWPILLTHFGISWPVTFSYSSQIPLIPISATKSHEVFCRPYADRNYEWRFNHINETISQNPKKQLITFLSHHFPTRRCESFCKAHDIDTTRYLSNLTREQKQHLANLLGNGFSINLIARRPWDEFVTAWWVNTDDIDPKTMQSLLCPWLYFAGEVLNIDAVTWWFNFQACWATGRCAGLAI